MLHRSLFCNPLNHDLFLELNEVREKMRIDAEGKVVIITGAGEEALVSGAKIKANHIRSISNNEGE